MTRRDPAVDLEAKTLENDDFRREFLTGEHSQIVLMTIPPGGEIGEEVHDGIDQLLVFVEGEANAILEGESGPIHVGQTVYVPAGTRHNFLNRGS